MFCGRSESNSQRPPVMFGRGCALCMPETHVGEWVGVAGCAPYGCSQQGWLSPAGQGQLVQAHVHDSHVGLDEQRAQQASTLSSCVGAPMFRPFPMFDWLYMVHEAWCGERRAVACSTGLNGVYTKA